MSFLEDFKAQLDRLGIDYVYDPDWDDEGVLIINSGSSVGKYLSIGLLFDKKNGSLNDLHFTEVNEHDGEFPVKRKEISNQN